MDFLRKKLKKIIKEAILLEYTLNIQNKEQLFKLINEAINFAREHEGESGYFTEKQLIGSLQETLSTYIGDNTKYYKEVILKEKD